MDRTVAEIEVELDELQESYLDAEDDMEQMQIERRFSRCLQEATDLDGIDRIAAGITITNWVRES